MLRRLKSWLKESRGVVAVEFAMIAIPFFTLLLGTVEISLYYATAVVLEGAAESAARVVRLGQEQGDPETAFKGQLCAMVSGIVNCDDIRYQAVTIPSGTFAGAQANQPQLDADGSLKSGFDAGTASDVVLIRVQYKYNFLIPFIGNMITADNGSSGSATLMSTVTVKNEPYNF